MNKRLKKKYTRINNMKRQEEILNEISKYFTLKHKVFGNGYFIMTFEDNSVCHFSLKETPDWKYGIWLNKNKGFHIFGEHYDLIDKFKPSATYVSFENDLQSFIHKVNDIKENPKLYFVDSLTGHALVDYKKVEYDDWFYYEGYQVIREYNNETGYYNKFTRDESITQEDFVNKEYIEFYEEKEQEIRNAKSDKEYAFKFFKELPNMFNEIIAVGVKDNNKKGFEVSPRYKITPVIKSNISQENFEDLYDKVFDLVRKTCYSDKVKTSEHRFDLDINFYESLEAIRASRGYNYKYYKQNV